MKPLTPLPSRLSRFLRNEKLPAATVALVLEALRPLGELLSLDDLSSTYTNPEDLAIRLGEKLDFQISETEKRSSTPSFESQSIR